MPVPLQDMSPDALPPTTDTRVQLVHGAPKYAQIGPDGGQALLNALFNGVNMSNIQAVLVIDLYTKFSDVLMGFLASRASFAVSVLYFGVCEDQTELDWVESTIREHLATQYETEKMPMPAGTKLRQITDDILDPMPVPPQMNRLVLAGSLVLAMLMPLGVCVCVCVCASVCVECLLAVLLLWAEAVVQGNGEGLDGGLCCSWGSWAVLWITLGASL